MSPTSRTGTTKWKALRLKAIRQAQRNGIENCPHCGIRLDYGGGQRHRASVEVDHIVPYAQGGTDTAENTQVTCSSCNKRMGDKRQRRPKRERTQPMPSITLKTSREW